MLTATKVTIGLILGGLMVGFFLVLYGLERLDRRRLKRTARRIQLSGGIPLEYARYEIPTWQRTLGNGRYQSLNSRLMEIGD